MKKKTGRIPWILLGAVAALAGSSLVTFIGDCWQVRSASRSVGPNTQVAYQCNPNDKFTEWIALRRVGNVFTKLDLTTGCNDIDVGAFAAETAGKLWFRSYQVKQILPEDKHGRVWAEKNERVTNLTYSCDEEMQWLKGRVKSVWISVNGLPQLYTLDLRPTPCSDIAVHATVADRLELPPEDVVAPVQVPE